MSALPPKADIGERDDDVRYVPKTDTHSGHNIMIDNAQVVIQAIRMVVDAVRAGQTSLKG